MARVALPGQQTAGGQASVAATMALEDGSVHAVRANMEVQQGSSSLTVVRWISRLNDFLANQGQSVIGSVGFNTTPTQGPRHSRATQPAITPAATPSRGQQQHAAADRLRDRLWVSHRLKIFPRAVDGRHSRSTRCSTMHRFSLARPGSR